MCLGSFEAGQDTKQRRKESNGRHENKDNEADAVSDSCIYSKYYLFKHVLIPVHVQMHAPGYNPGRSLVNSERNSLHTALDGHVGDLVAATR